jgi:hypothetical protein
MYVDREALYQGRAPRALSKKTTAKDKPVFNRSTTQRRQGVEE